MSSWFWGREEKLNTVMDAENKGFTVRMKASTTMKPGYGPCLSSGDRRCADGSCIARVNLCSEEQMMNESTILIMVVVGMAVVIFVIILYCFQQRAQRHSHSLTTPGTFDPAAEEGDNSSLNLPPPTYDEVVNTNLYPATPVLQRNVYISAGEEPRTPPPNYNAALDILSHSHETIPPMKDVSKSPVVRRSISSEFGPAGSARSPRPTELDYRRVFSNPDYR